MLFRISFHVVIQSGDETWMIDLKLLLVLFFIWLRRKGRETGTINTLILDTIQFTHLFIYVLSDSDDFQ